MSILLLRLFLYLFGSFFEEYSQLFQQKEDEPKLVLKLEKYFNYFRLPSHSTLTLVVAGSAEMSLETAMEPSNIPLTIAL